MLDVASSEVGWPFLDLKRVVQPVSAARCWTKKATQTVWDLHCAADNACDIINEIELLIHRLAEEVKGKKALSQAKGSSKHTGLLHNHYSWFQSPLNMSFN